MSEETRNPPSQGHGPTLVHPGPLSITDRLRHIDPAPDDETERFVAAIDADRRGERGNRQLH